MTLVSNTPRIALIFEGGGMRNALTAAVASTLLRTGIHFPKAYGISAGAELAVDYISRSLTRLERFFPTLAHDPKAGGARSFLRGRGFFNTAYAFVDVARKAERAARETAPTSGLDYAALRFDYPTLAATDADVHIEAFDARTGTTKAWEKASMPDTDAVMERVAASCSYPLFTPPLYVDGVRYIDGGMGTSHGLCLDAAIADGFTRFFVVRTQPRDHRMPPLNPAKRACYKAAYARLPKAYEAIAARPAAYNALLDRIDGLERDGVAYVFCPTTMPLTYMTSSPARLEAAYQAGLAQFGGELDRCLDWLFRR